MKEVIFCTTGQTVANQFGANLCTSNIEGISGLVMFVCFIVFVVAVTIFIESNKGV